MTGNIGPDYLDHISSLQDVQAYKKLMLEALNPSSGKKFLDVGCGVGKDIAGIAGLVGGNGRAVGIDIDPEMIAKAKQRFSSSEFPTLQLQEGDAYALDFPDNTFDAIQADRVFLHLENPWEALQEMIRVARPMWGRIVIYDSDWESLLIRVDESFYEITRKLLNFSCDNNFMHGWIGRDLTSLFKRAELMSIHTTPVTGIIQEYDVACQIFRLEEVAAQAKQAGIADDEKISLWLEHLKALGKKGYFFSSITGFIVTGFKG